VVDVVDERVERADALGEAALAVARFAGGDDARDEVERKRPVARRAVGVRSGGVERDALLNDDRVAPPAGAGQRLVTELGERPGQRDAWPVPWLPMRFAVMIEGQEGVAWDDWVALARACERLGFEALFRSDHYLSVMGGAERGSLDAWATVSALAAITSELRLGTLVSPATFRHPSVLAKNAVTADHVSGGRIDVGLGTGWNEPEHRAYGFPFPRMRERMDRLAEQLEIVTRSWQDGAFSFRGEHYSVDELDARPKPVQSPLPLIMGGGAMPRGAALAARYASEYNVVHATPDEAAAAGGRLAQACSAAGRDPATLRFSLMHGLLIGADENELAERARQLGDDLAGLRGSWIAGTPEQVIARLRAYEGVGVERVMLQHLLFRDEAALELFAREVMPAFA
jgi:F420-dependent oxidoreductase-like protein